METPFNTGYAIGSSVEVYQNASAIGGSPMSHVMFGEIVRYTRTQVVFRNPKLNPHLLVRAYLANSRIVGNAYDTMTPTYVMKC